jgi:hypothetical protein
MRPLVSDQVGKTLSHAAHRLGTANPMRLIGGAVQDAFSMSVGDDRYRHNSLSPGVPALEASFNETEPYGLRFTMEPLDPGASAAMKRAEASRQVRRWILPMFGRDALYWFDRVSEDFRGTSGGGGLRFGGWFGGSLDRDGLYNSRAYYELNNQQLAELPQPLKQYIETARGYFPRLQPLFATISVRQRSGREWATFRVMGALQVEALRPMLSGLGLEAKMAQLTRLFGLALGGAFEAPDGGVLIGITAGPDGPELTVDLLLAAIPEIPDSFVELLRLGLAERPRHLRALDTWIDAFTPQGAQTPGDFSVLSIHLKNSAPAQVSLHLRPMGFEIADEIA